VSRVVPIKPVPTTSATEKLMMLGGFAVCRLYVAHMQLRKVMKPDSIDPAELERCADQLRQIAWEIERSRT
jgi:hypothetical protein